ncbi:hypothetical protein QBC37DRAFT_100665 [Rhypophila decipiens]|uniref:Uncharacterized protein n=1 Tax=Rhypophila decipiens TaxID=261697 RepID=A0AAN6YCP9_9PEZI|nr:hypothetical protein QBC37DRAFT_100665 [Rhypophila decipiens]
MEAEQGGHIYGRYAMGSRIPLMARDMVLETVGEIPSAVLVARDDEDCPNGPCKKPYSTSQLAVPIALGVIIPVVAIVIALFFLHRMVKKRHREEERADPHKSLDFGLAENPGGKPKRKSFLGIEKDGSRFKRQQMSMDMNLSTPYLLPPEIQGSQDSLNSLARTINQHEDPYRHINAYPGSDTGSVRSMPRGTDGASTYTRSASRQDGRGSRPPPSPGPYSPPPRQDSFPKPPVASPERTYHKPDNVDEEPILPPLTISKDAGFSFGELSMPAAPGDEKKDFASMPAIQEPAPVAHKVARNPITSPPQPSPADSGVEMGYDDDRNGKPKAQDAATPLQPTVAGLGLLGHHEPMQATIHEADEPTTMPNSPPPRGQSLAAKPMIEEPVEYYDFDDYPQAGQPEAKMPAMPRDQYDEPEERGRNMQRQSRFYEQDNRKSGLGVPSQDNRRLSVGFRPLPPDEIMESEDPEYRANRIRSFYKEYFEDSKPGDAPPVPQLPAQHQHPRGRPQNNAGPAQNSYYEDYDANYAADLNAPYFDPETNSFVMPYAQPVARRAMTPPPSGQRFPGPRPPRAFHGSMGGPNMPGPRGPHGPPSRPGSSFSNRPGFQSPRPGSSVSGAYGRPRAGSAYTGSRAGSQMGGPRKPIPPPADLPTLPTPSMLKDDNFALFNAMDFAPPETFAERARGRSQSPAGERRPYQMNVPAHSPLVNAFEELPALPSPHLLRKSSTFTALDFAPPKKFVDSDNRSDAGSIRSHRSGISAVQQQAIKAGAGRVSRLPGDQVFTAAALQDTLKPQWGMRP